MIFLIRFSMLCVFKNFRYPPQHSLLAEHLPVLFLRHDPILHYILHTIRANSRLSLTTKTLEMIGGFRIPHFPPAAQRALVLPNFFFQNATLAFSQLTATYYIQLPTSSYLLYKRSNNAMFSLLFSVLALPLNHENMRFLI